MNEKIEQAVINYYNHKLSLHGATPQGVDWNSQSSQELRFDQLSRVFESTKNLSLIDYGCGYGAFVDYLQARSLSGDYIGYDLSEKMLEAGREISRPNWNCEFIETLPSAKADYLVASGIFNVRQHETDAVWKEYVLSELGKMASVASKGMAFNMLTSYSDIEKRKDYLYYADPLEIFDFCKRNLSAKVACLHDYPLYEFTMLVRF